MRRTITLVLVAFAALGMSACGTSKEDKAQASVCKARTDIGRQITALEGLKADTQSSAQAKASLSAIGEDLTKIKAAQADLSASRKKETGTANAQFAAAATQIAQRLDQGSSLKDAAAHLSAAAAALGQAYKATIKQFGCS